MTFKATLGQLYVVRTRGEYKKDRTIEKCVLIMQACNPEEIEPKLRFHFDTSKYLTFSIVSIEKVKPHVHTLSTSLIPVSDLDGLPSNFRLETPMSDSKAEKHRTNQPSNSKIFAVGVVGRMAARDGDHAFRKLGKYLLKLGLGDEADSPLFEGGKVIVDEEGPTDSTVTSASQFARLDATYMRNQKPVSAGLPSLGKR